MRLSGHGVAIDVPDHWEGRIFRRDGAGPVLHLASFPLHAGDGDYGAAATGRMRAGDGFAALLEFRDPERIRPGVGLYASLARPAPRAAEFSAAGLQVTRPGQLGWQRFFTEAGRTCCLYVVIQPGHVRAARLLASLEAVLGTLTLAPV